jgi:undecaprenyl-phosphate galactose phosphotransferase
LVKILNATWYSGYRIVEVMKLGSIKGGYSTCFIPFQYTNEELIKNIKSIFKTLIMVSEVAGLSFMNTEIKTFLSKNIMLITTKSGLLSLQKMIFKRVLDTTLSLFSIIILFPLLLAISIIIKLDSRGPIFFKHKRIGKNLKEFTMYKFRTMYMDSEKTLKEFLATHPEAYQDLEERNKLKDDPRVTRWGRFLRRSSLDELPQFFNVLIGHMSIVGPRPDSREAVKNYLDEYKEIYRMVRPGITGLWQVSGRSEIIYQERVKLDYLYILNWSVWLDFVIILKTIQTIISGKGAY